jgi:signal transduction histidine kinase
VGIRPSFQEQIDRFYDLIEEAIVTGDPDWLNPILDDWVRARVYNKPGEAHQSLTPILEQIFEICFEVIQEKLSDREALDLIISLIPIYSHAMRYISRKETFIYIDQVTERLDEANYALERLDKTKSDFIAIAAHELKTPLTLIEGYSGMLQEQMDIVDAEDKTQILLRGIDNGTRRLNDIINDMIDISKIDSDTLVLNLQPIRVSHLLQSLAAEFNEKAQIRGHTFVIKEFPGIQETIMADEERLGQAFQNILANAIKYTPDGGRISIDGRILPGFVEIKVSDTGIGINAVDHDIIFEKFGRLGKVALHSSSKTNYKGGGPGLGLPITKGIVEAHGGTIWVESEGYDEVELPGTTFHILLPLQQEPPDRDIKEIFRASAGSSDFSDIYAKHLESPD